MAKRIDTTTPTEPRIYPAGSKFGWHQTFPPNTLFGAGCEFGGCCEFGDHCTFAAGCEFGSSCRFGDGCRFGAHCEFDEFAPRFGERCHFTECCFPDFIHFGPRSHFKDCTFSLRNAFGWNCTFEGRNDGLPKLLDGEIARLKRLLKEVLA